MSLHGRILNIAIKTPHDLDKAESLVHAYIFGHRDARRAAAELAFLADVESAELRLLVRGIVDNRNACFVPNDKEGLFNWDERAARVLGDA